MTKIAPSILSADFAHMAEGISAAESWGVDIIHCDVMDGVFVPNITFGPKMIADIRKITKLPLDVHLMIDAPERYVEAFAAAGADIITVHVEATTHLQRTLRAIRDAGARPGAVLNPATPVETLKYVLDDVDMVLLMTVNPGFGGQKFIPAMMEKIADMRALIAGRNIEIEIDGGVNSGNAGAIVSAGADILVAGSALYGAADPATEVRKMQQCSR